MEFWSGHDLNNDGKNDVFLRHELKPGDPAVRMFVLIVFVPIAIVGLLAQPFMLIGLCANPETRPFGIFFCVMWVAVIVFCSVLIYFHRRNQKNSGKHRAGELKDRELPKPLAAANLCPKCRVGMIGNSQPCSHCGMRPSDFDRERRALADKLAERHLAERLAAPTEDEIANVVAAWTENPSTKSTAKTLQPKDNAVLCPACNRGFVDKNRACSYCGFQG